MKISVIGTGYVGLVTGTCFSDMGNEVVCADIDEGKIQKLRQNIIPIYEPGLEELVKKNTEAGRLTFTTNIKEAVENTDICFIAVGTPPGEDGSADLQYVLSVARDIGRYINDYKTVVNKSTVPVGTAEKVKKAIAEELQKRGANYDFDVVSNPEFLKEGMALDDFFRPDRIVIGVQNGKSREVMEDVYSPFVRSGAPVLFMGVKSAEMTKYAANAMLAARISFMNEVANICDGVGADVEEVRQGIGSDKRIGHSFLYSGTGYGGSCFPKDVRAFSHIADGSGVKAYMAEAIEVVNNAQKRTLVEKIIRHFGSDLSGKTFAVWGLSFKPNTDDMREAPSVVIIESLLKAGAGVRAFDPKATSEARKIFGEKIFFADDQYEALQGSDALILVTEWGMFREPDFEKMKQLMKGRIIFDGRNQYKPIKMQKLGFEYVCIGRPIKQTL